MFSLHNKIKVFTSKFHVFMLIFYSQIRSKNLISFWIRLSEAYKWYSMIDRFWVNSEFLEPSENRNFTFWTWPSVTLPSVAFQINFDMKRIFKPFIKNKKLFNRLAGILSKNFIAQNQLILTFKNPPEFFNNFFKTLFY